MSGKGTTLTCVRSLIQVTRQHFAPVNKNTDFMIKIVLAYRHYSLLEDTLTG